MNLLAFFLAASTASAATADDAKEAVLALTALENAYDVKTVEYYADDAVIELFNTETNQPVSFTGAQYKAVAARAMEGAKHNQEKSTLSNISVVSESETRFVVTAARTAESKCYTEPEHQYILEVRDGRLLVVSEKGTSVELSQCKPSKAVKKALNAYVKTLPPAGTMIDDETALGPAVVKGENLILNYKLVHLTAADVDEPQLHQGLMQMALPAGCKDPTLRSFLDQGAVVQFAYAYSDDALIKAFTVRSGLCLFLGL